MSLSQAIAQLATRVGEEFSTRIDAEHPGLARAWSVVRVQNAWAETLATFNATVTRTGRGRYRIDFLLPLPEAAYAVLAHGDDTWPLSLMIDNRSGAGFDLTFSLLGIKLDPSGFACVVYR